MRRVAVPSQNTLASDSRPVSPRTRFARKARSCLLLLVPVNCVFLSCNPVHGRNGPRIGPSRLEPQLPCRNNFHPIFNITCAGFWVRRRGGQMRSLRPRVVVSNPLWSFFRPGTKRSREHQGPVQDRVHGRRKEDGEADGRGVEATLGNRRGGRRSPQRAARCHGFQETSDT